MLQNGLPRTCRLHTQKDFERVIKGGRKLQAKGLVMWVCSNPSPLSNVRFAVVVSRKLGPAVVRNRTKRLLREAFRRSRTQLKQGVDMVVRPQSSEKLLHVQAAQEALTTLYGKAGLMCSSTTDKEEETKE